MRTINLKAKTVEHHQMNSLIWRFCFLYRPR